MSPTANQASGGQRGGRGITLVPLATVLARLDEVFEEPLVRAALLPGYAEYETALAAIDGWSATGEPLVLMKGEPDCSGPDHHPAVWHVIDNIHVLAAAKKVGKSKVPCSFIRKEDVASYCSSANAGGGLKPPGASAEDEEEAIYRAYWP